MHIYVCILTCFRRRFFKDFTWDNFRDNKQKYFKKFFFKYLDFVSILFPLFIIPFHIIHSPAQWVFASIGYLCLALQGFEFAAVFKCVQKNLGTMHSVVLIFSYHRSTGAYVHILRFMLGQDLMSFLAVFSLFLFGFTGALYFSLRGEEITTMIVTFNNCSLGIDDENCSQIFTTVESSSLDKSPHLTE